MLTGDLLIAGERVRAGETFEAINPATGETLSASFSAAGTAEVERACAAAQAAFAEMQSIDHLRRADLLDAIADAIVAIGDPLLERARQESGLPLARLTGERGRTAGQLKLFARELRAGAWMRLRIDPALPDRAPLPRPDLRLRTVPVGPVAVFGASNFPLAFSVAGGDTASALAAGCPVVVKGHPSHPGTSELVAQAVADAVRACGFPAGTFSLLNGPSYELGTALVSDPRIKAVGFTGSRAGGVALMKVAAARPVPIPVYAEMSSINPVLLFPAALADRAEALARDFIGSLTLGAGQFCTNPGLVIALDGPELDRFLEAGAVAMAPVPAATMLSPGIHSAYEEGVARLSSHARVQPIARGTGGGQTCGQAALFAISGKDFAGDEQVQQEVFGASSLVVRCDSPEEMADVIEGLEGQLTATIHFDEADHLLVRRMLPHLEGLAGRLVANGWPTGVEVSHAMVHGGPYPATSDGRSTSVGTLAIERFLRPVCYQDFPDDLLPASLRRGAQDGLPHLLDGVVRAG
ncbi:MAG TPA: aldehyde dehydrogenase (NADP(+)) [Allosphingosinicella sp.]|jgi:NADP-dependent aldehyde dehydrogenase